jgi:hypothetical protein
MWCDAGRYSAIAAIQLEGKICSHASNGAAVAAAAKSACHKTVTDCCGESRSSCAAVLEISSLSPAISRLSDVLLE